MPKKILIELPTWLGDAVMSTPAIENILENNDADITVVGSYVAVNALGDHPRVLKNIVLDKSYIPLIKTALSLKDYDIAISFRSSIRSLIFISLVGADLKYRYKKDKQITRHQVLRYNDFINASLNTTLDANILKLYQKKHLYNKPTLGINPGATYGSAKRWYPEKFAEVANKLKDDYDIVIFGGDSEKKIAQDIENMIHTKVLNLAGKTSVKELIQYIGGLELFITNDSGPMHIAAAYSVKTVSIFGPTKSDETNQWKNNNGVIVKKDLDCAPCMKRVCPLEHHECMKEISAQDALTAIAQMSHQ